MTRKQEGHGVGHQHCFPSGADQSRYGTLEHGDLDCTLCLTFDGHRSWCLFPGVRRLPRRWSQDPCGRGSSAPKRPSAVEASWRLCKHERRPLPAKSQQSPIEAIAALTTKKPFPQPMTWRDFTHLPHLLSTVPSATGHGRAAVEHQAVCDRPDSAQKNQLPPSSVRNAATSQLSRPIVDDESTLRAWTRRIPFIITPSTSSHRRHSLRPTANLLAAIATDVSSTTTPSPSPCFRRPKIPRAGRPWPPGVDGASATPAPTIA